MLKRGITREIFITENFVIKFHSVRNWKLFLTGLLANIQEVYWWNTTKDSRLCPVAFGFTGGWFLIMKKAKPIDENYLINYDYFVGLPLDHLDHKNTNFL